jgi:hypothetical protein
MTRPITGNSSLFQQKLQSDGVLLCELIDLYLPNGAALHFTTANNPITYTLSGADTSYRPFPGSGGGMQEDTLLGVSVVDFVMSNANSSVAQQLVSNDFALCNLKIGRVFTDTPNLGRMDIYNGKVGDFSYDRHEVTGQARNYWKSLNVQWPYYTYRDTCGWRFGSVGCGKTRPSYAINSINVSSSDTRLILVASGYLTRSFANGQLEFGRATVTGGVNSGFVRAIIGQSGDLISLSSDLPYSDISGMKLLIEPGCKKRLIEDCKSLYNNDKKFLWISLDAERRRCFLTNSAPRSARSPLVSGHAVCARRRASRAWASIAAASSTGSTARTTSCRRCRTTMLLIGRRTATTNAISTSSCRSCAKSRACCREGSPCSISAALTRTPR